MSSVVLVHGAFHGGWCWRQVAGRLRTSGHQVFTPTLTGLGERAHLLSARVDLETHVLDIVNIIEWEELKEVVLVAHSYSGVPVTVAADQIWNRLAALVYLDSYVPADGESWSSIRARDGVPLALDTTSDGLAVLPPPAGYFGLEGELATYAERRMTPHPVATMKQPARLSGLFRRIPCKAYIRTSRFPAPFFDRYHAAATADPDWIAIRYDAPHNVMLTNPDWLCRTLEEQILPIPTAEQGSATGAGS